MKKKWLVLMVSLIVPGLGYCYLKHKGLVLITFIIVVLLATSGVNSVVSYSGNAAHGFDLLFVVFLIWFLSVTHAFIIAIKEDRTGDHGQDGKNKDPFLAAALSFFLPGLGQFYVRDFVNGVSFLVLYFMGVLILSPQVSILLLWLLKGISSCFAANRIRGTPNYHIRYVFTMIGLVYGIVFLEVTGCLLIEQNFYSVAKAKGHSMEPTILSGDVLLVDRKTKAHLRRGDIVFFSAPDGKNVIKRIAAFGGEIIEIKDGGGM